jgi:hypothetical protein
LTKACSIDRTNEQEVAAFNKLMDNYKQTLFNETAVIPKDETGKSVDLDEVFKKKRATLKKVEFKKVASSIKEEFTNMGIKDLIKMGK